jgi:hypothetical protein
MGAAIDRAVNAERLVEALDEAVDKLLDVP